VLSLLKKIWSKNKEKEMTTMTSITEDDYDDELLGEDEWEDYVALNDILKKYPPDWYLVKAVNFTYGTMNEMKQWCIDNCQGKYDNVGWDSGCSYTVGVIFESHTEAILFKLTWSGV
jgi:hypothetical protein